MSDAPRTTFHAPEISQGAVLLRRHTHGSGGKVTAYLRGVPLGDAVEVEQQDIVYVPVVRLPHVPLPTEIRLGWEDGSEASEALTVVDSLEATTLCGEGALVDVDASITNGYLRGTARNPYNGVAAPKLFARINGTVERQVRSKVTGPNPEGGANIQFEMPIDAKDFTTEGGVIELVFATSQQRLWHIALGPVAETHADAIKVLRQASLIDHTLRARLAETEGRLGARMAVQEQLVEDVTTYLLALIHDRAALGQQSAQDRELARSLLTKLIPAEAPQAEAASALVDMASPYWGKGWSDPIRTNEGLDARQFTSAATVLCPQPLRAVHQIVLSVIEAKSAAVQQLQALCDADQADLSIVGVDEAPCTVVITPKVPVPVRILTLVGNAGSGAVAVQGVRFDFADAP